MPELDKKLMQTPDLNKERLETLKTLFPDLFTVEGKLHPDELMKIVDPELVKESERFEFKWFGKSEAKRNAFTPSRATLVYDEQRSVNHEYSDGNMIIEGENLESLKCLLSAYRERIKCLYIDPPYNTGKDFVYSDKWDESKENYWDHIGITSNGVKIDTNSESSGRFHSNWLNMMYSRLLIARQLLRDDGVIFISIDDCEVHYLRKLCEDVFGAENFIAQISREAIKGGSQSKSLRNVHDYILCFAKYSQEANFSGYEKEGIVLDLEDEYGKYAKGRELNKWGAGSRREDSPGMFFPIKGPNGEDVYPIRNDGSEGRWRLGKKKMSLLSENDGIIFEKRENGTYICYQKIRESKSGIKQFTSLFKENYLNAKGTEEIKKLFSCERTYFDYAKPKELIFDLMLMCDCDNSDIVMDFFAGSGSTGQAVYEYNNEFETDCKFILIQIPELTDEKSEAFKADYRIISDITIERNKRVIQKLINEESENNPDLLSEDKKPLKLGFKVYKLAKSNFPRIDFAPDPAKTEDENLALLNTYIQEKEAIFLSTIDGEYIFDEVLLKNGFLLNYSKIQDNTFTENTIYEIKDSYKSCLICMDMTIEKITLKELESHKDQVFICLERALDTTMKWNLKHLLGEKLIAF
ncbi:MAG: site-specific DNA-methyltransferase [Bacilli bacterium]|nr:site-specific DNA-methyltransferase [Bacilli bacterium]